MVWRPDKGASPAIDKADALLGYAVVRGTSGDSQRPMGVDLGHRAAGVGTADFAGDEGAGFGSRRSSEASIGASVRVLWIRRSATGSSVG